MRRIPSISMGADYVFPHEMDPGQPKGISRKDWHVPPEKIFNKAEDK
jgi:hypothetical protein